MSRPVKADEDLPDFTGWVLRYANEETTLVTGARIIEGKTKLMELVLKDGSTRQTTFAWFVSPGKVYSYGCGSEFLRLSPPL